MAWCCGHWKENTSQSWENCPRPMFSKVLCTRNICGLIKSMMKFQTKTKSSRCRKRKKGTVVGVDIWNFILLYAIIESYSSPFIATNSGNVIHLFSLCGNISWKSSIIKSFCIKLIKLAQFAFLLLNWAFPEINIGDVIELWAHYRMKSTILWLNILIFPFKILISHYIRCFRPQ